MLQHSLQPGHHSVDYVQCASISKQRSEFIYIYGMSNESAYDRYIMCLGSEPPSHVGIFLTGTHWLNRCSNSCNTCMKFILKKDKSVSI